MRIYVVINVVGGIIDSVDTFSQKEDAERQYRNWIYQNSSFTGKEVGNSYHADSQYIWQKDSYIYLYDKNNDLYYPISTGEHDVSLQVSNVDGEE